MCGIAGLFHRDGRPIAHATIAAMTEAIRHRGPDGSGIWTDGDIALGHRRLAIRDLSPAGRQPFSDQTGRVWISYNGEIYNDQELRRDLEREHGVRFKTSCDTEIIPAGYMAWGHRVFERLEGMFAVALWDRKTRELFLARDGIGIKPLFYSANSHSVRFASEIKGLLADPEQRREVSPLGLHRFLAMGYAGPQSTTLQGIEQVPPGTILTFTGTSQTSHQYWQPQRRPRLRQMGEAVDGFSEIWMKVVSDQLVSDVPVGILQSSGIDSTLVSLAAAASKPASLFTVSFGDKSFDEVSGARLVAQGTGSQLHVINSEAAGAFASALPAVVNQCDGQIADEAATALYILSREVRRHVTVALSGDGGDEFFAGYPTYRASAWAARIGRLMPASAWNWIGQRAYELSPRDETRLPASAILSRFAFGINKSPVLAHARWRCLVPAHMLKMLYGPALAPLIGENPFHEYEASIAQGSGDLLDRCLVADQRYHLPGGLLAKTDAMSMAHGLEIRVPFLDRRMMEFANSIDRRLLLGEIGPGKRVLRAAAESLNAPAEVVNGKKRGFNVPIARLLRGELREHAEMIFERSPEYLEPFLKSDAVRILWRAHLGGRANHAYVLWPILTFGIWQCLASEKRTLADTQQGAVT